MNCHFGTSSSYKLFTMNYIKNSLYNLNLDHSGSQTKICVEEKKIPMKLQLMRVLLSRPIFLVTILPPPTFYFDIFVWIFFLFFQYNLDFNVLANRAGREQFRDGDDGSGVGGVGSDGKMNSGSGSDASMWQFGMARRSKGDGRRTRVSFLLFWAIRVREISDRSDVRLPFFFFVIPKTKTKIERRKRKKQRRNKRIKKIVGRNAEQKHHRRLYNRVVSNRRYVLVISSF